MGRGNNYVNNNKGVALQATKKQAGRKGAIKMIACQYGAGCTRSDCIYSHPSTKSGETVQSMEPCMAFLAGTCAFSAKGCRKRHPSKQEAEHLTSKYQQTRCRFGVQCRTNGCLYLHPRDEDDPYSIPALQQCQVLPQAQGSTDVNYYSGGGRVPNWGYNEYYTASYDAPAEAMANANANTIHPTDPQLDEMRIEGKNVNAREFVPGSWKSPS